MSRESPLRQVLSLGVLGPSASGEYRLCCPFCGGRYKVYANPTRRAWHCFKCNAKGRGDLEFIGPAQAQQAQQQPDLGRPDGFLELAAALPVLKPYVAYLGQRGVLEEAVAAGAGACVSGRYAGRVVLPHVVNGTWSGFVARAIFNAEPKYLFPAGMPKKTTLWGYDTAKRAAGNVYLVEGVFDALPLAGTAVAAFGKHVSDEQLELLKALGRPVVVALDGDAWAEGQVLSRRLELRGVDSYWVRLGPTQDPGTLGQKIFGLPLRKA